MADKPPYVTGYGGITKALNKIQEAATPPRFTQDFLATKLGLQGGSSKPIIPFLKRTGFLGSDGVPTDLYKRFRNPSQRGNAATEALKKGYTSLYEINEYVHDATDKDLKGVVVQATGLEADSAAARSIVGSFKALKAFATFGGADAEREDIDGEDNGKEKDKDESEKDLNKAVTSAHGRSFGLSYTINLNLPATSDIAVFDAIFRSIKEHLLK
jgi:hypothetical protein